MRMITTVVALALCVTIGEDGFAANDTPVPGDPSDVSRGKPQDIPQELFVIVRRHCTQEWPEDFDMRAFCERKQFEGIRKLRGDKQ